MPAPNEYPKLRAGLVISEMTQKGERVCIVKDPVTRRIFRFGETEHFIARALDGIASPDDIRDRFQESFGVSLPREKLDAFVGRLDALGLIDRGLSDAAIARTQRGAGERGSRRGLYIKLKTVDPDRVFSFIAPRMRFFFSRYFALVTILLSIGALWINVANWGDYADQAQRLLRLGTIPALFLAVVMVVVLHETAHGLLCTHYGGRVSEMGFLLMYLLPAFYCNVSDAWLFEDKRKRIWVSFAGIFFQIFMWAVAAIVWRIVDQETFLSDFSVLVMVTSGVSALFSLNPLIKLDGYYMLVDWLEMPNLRRKAFAYLLTRLIPRRGAGGAREAGPSESEKRVYLWYGIAAVVYSLALIAFIVLKAAAFVVSRYHGAGLLALAAALILLFTGTLEKWTIGIRRSVAERKGPGMKRRRLTIGLGIGAACILVLVFAKWDLRITGRFILLPDDRATIRAEVEGILSEILVDEGDTVRAGQTIARIDDREYRAQLAETEAEMAKGAAQLALLRKGPLEIEIDRLRKVVERSKMQVSYAEKEYERVGELYRKNLVSPNEYEKAQQELDLSRKDLERSEGDLRVLAVGNRPETIREAEAEMDRLRASQAYLAQQIERAEIRSPLAGIVSTHRLRDRLKEFLEIGDEICEIVSCGKMLLEMPVSEKDIVDVREGMPVKLKARSLPAAAFPGRVVSVPPVAVDRMNRTVLIVTAEVDNPQYVLKPGMTGAARIYCGKRSLIDLLTRKIIRFIRVEFWWW